MTERLEGARRDLEDRRSGGVPVSVIADRWCFAGSTHFGRRFRATYGCSPREWRRLHRAVTVPDPRSHGPAVGAWTQLVAGTPMSRSFAASATRGG